MINHRIRIERQGEEDGRGTRGWMNENVVDQIKSSDVEAVADRLLRRIGEQKDREKILRGSNGWVGSFGVYEEVYPAASGPMDGPTMYNVRRSHGAPGPAKVLAPYWAQSHRERSLFVRPRPLLPLSVSVPSGPARGELLRLYCRALKQCKRRKNNTTLLPGTEPREEVARDGTRVALLALAIYRGSRSSKNT